MKIIDVAQGSEEWAHARAGIPTASELDNLVSPTGKIRTGEMPYTYLCIKLAEKWTGGPLPSFMSRAMENGSILESEAVPWFELDRGVDVRRVGFITTDDGAFGCSPDGLLTDDTGLEIKCPLAQTHLRWLLAGELPAEHALQCHGGMYVTGAKRWTFMSYCRGFPAFIVEVPRDEAMIEKIGDALAMFREKFTAGFDAIVKANGGPRVDPHANDDHPF